MFDQLPLVYIIFYEFIFESIDKPINVCIVDPFINIEHLL